MTLCCSDFVYQAGGRPLIEVPFVEFQRGQVTVIKGPSGAGKSTLLYCLAGIDVAQGRLSLDNQVLPLSNDQQREQYRRAHISLVFQNIHLLSGLTILENVLLPLTFDQWQPSKAQREYALSLLTGFGFSRPHEPVDFLSRGEKQRIAIARAFVTQPSVLLADEPTASLDTESSQAVIQLLRQAADANQIVIVTSHDPLVQSSADSLLSLERGRFV